jgi:hypothetical protein
MAPADRRRPGRGMTRPLGRCWSGQPEPCWRSAGRHRHRQSRSARTWCSPPPRWHRCSACPGQCNFRFRVHSPARAPQCSRTAPGQGRSTSFFIARPPTLIPLDVAHYSGMISPTILGEIKSEYPGEIIGIRTPHTTRSASALRSATVDQAFRARSSRKAVCPETGARRLRPRRSRVLLEPAATATAAARG